MTAEARGSKKTLDPGLTLAWNGRRLGDAEITDADTAHALHGRGRARTRSGTAGRKMQNADAWWYAQPRDLGLEEAPPGAGLNSDDYRNRIQPSLMHGSNLLVGQ